MHSLDFSVIATLLLFSPPLLIGGAPPAAISAFDSYTRAVEARLDHNHRSPDSFLAPSASHPENADARLRHGELIIEQLTPSAADLPGGLLHHWRGTAFAPGATAADFESLLRDVDSYPRYFSPQVLQARILMQEPDRIQTKLRVRQRNLITVVMDATYDVTFGQLDARHGYSTSRSTRISEIESAGTSAERPLDAGSEHGFLWRMNTSWSYEERGGGLYLQIEAISLTHSIPRGLEWLIQPWVQRIPGESLEFTLRCALRALRN
jgi:hypothetical protein